jgi:hypothetical protein
LGVVHLGDDRWLSLTPGQSVSGAWSPTLSPLASMITKLLLRPARCQDRVEPSRLRWERPWLHPWGWLVVRWAITIALGRPPSSWGVSMKLVALGWLRFLSLKPWCNSGPWLALFQSRRYGVKCWPLVGLVSRFLVRLSLWPLVGLVDIGPWLAPSSFHGW